MKKQLYSSFFKRFKKLILGSKISSNEEFIQVLKEAEQNRVIDSHLRIIIEGTLQLENLKVSDVMVPKSQIVFIKKSYSARKSLAKITESGHSRFPFLNTREDKVKGIIFAKDLLDHFVNKKDKELNYKDYLCTAILVPESKTLGALLRDFQQQRSHMAIVIDEYGEITGLITLEDVLEQIVGEIEDEHDLRNENIIELGNDVYLLKAHTSLEEFNELLNTNLKAEGVDTVAGLVISAFTRLPQRMDEISIEGFNFKVLKTDTRSIRLLEVKKLKNKN
jgi:magnesium and cobalt transporter